MTNCVLGACPAYYWTVGRVKVTKGYILLVLLCGCRYKRGGRATSDGNPAICHLAMTTCVMCACPAYHETVGSVKVTEATSYCCFCADAGIRGRTD